MADSSGEEAACRSVQFRGLSTYYVAAEEITVSFRYPTEGFKVDARDWIGLAADTDSDIEQCQCVCRASVGDPTRHRPCDGGVWKVGTVGLTLPQEGGGNYRLRYVSHGGGVVGRSEPFTLCSDLSEFPSITIQSLEDHVFIDKLRDQSPMLLSSNSANQSSSFVLVTEDSHSAPHRKSVDHSYHSGNDSVGGSAEEGTASTDKRNDKGGTQVECEEEVTGVAPVIIRVCPSGEAWDHVQTEGCTAGEQCHQEHCPEGKQTESPLEVVSPLVDPAETGGVEEGGKQFIKEVDMSESMVLVQGISEREAWRLKQNNKELWIKIRKLSDRMEGLQQENELLKGQLDREKTEKQRMKRRILQLENMAVELEAAKNELEEQGHQIVEEKQSLRVTVGQLQSELMAVSVHCRKLLDQVNESERRVRMVGEENVILQRQVEDSEKHRRRRKKQEQKGEEGKGKEVVDSPKLSRERKRQERQGVEPGRVAQGSRGRQKHRHRPREERDKVSHSDVSPGTKQLQQSSEGMSVEARKEGVEERILVEAKERQLSEGRVEEIASCLKGRHVTSYQCPVCQKQLHARENEYSVLLHIEHCLTRQAH